MNFALPGASDSTMVEPIKIVWQAYPKQAESENMQGQAQVRAFINESGDLEKEEIVDSTDRVFNQPALDAVKEWKFKPFLAHGKPIPVTAKVPADFVFSDKVSDTATPVQKYAGEEPATSDAPKPTRVASGVMAGKLIHRVDPAYSWQARNWHIQGAVALHALMTKEGRIGSLQLISEDQALVKAAMGAVQQWRYEPFLLNARRGGHADRGAIHHEHSTAVEVTEFRSRAPSAGRPAPPDSRAGTRPQSCVQQCWPWLLSAYGRAR